jgi:hypothetical protein
MILTKAHKMMIEDGFPAELLFTQEQRKAAWDAAPPKANNWRKEPVAKPLPKAFVEKPKNVKKVPSIDTSGKRWNPNNCRWEDTGEGMQKPKLVSARASPRCGKIDLKKMVVLFQVKQGSFRELLLTELVTHKDRVSSIEELAQAVYGDKAKASACVMVMKGLVTTIEKKSLPFGIEKTDKGYQLFEA